MTTLMVMAGGTGGHVYPAIAVADALSAQGWRIVWLATEGGMENRLIAGKGFEVAMIRMSGVRGKGLLKQLIAPLLVLRACWQSASAMRRARPDVVLGMGGFAALPGGLVARLLGFPLVIHEQNAIAGLTNRILAKFASQRLAAFPFALGKHTALVGNPVRAEIAALALPARRYADRSGPLHVLVVGGSLGAQALNQRVPLALASLSPTQRPQVIHQAGEQHLAELRQHYRQAGVEADTRAFITDMAASYAWADVVICRAGALTIAELAVAGVASILVPFPHAVDDHQTHNARYLADQGAAWLIPQHELSARRLADLLKSASRDALLAMAEQARALGKPEATATVARICREAAA